MKKLLLCFLAFSNLCLIAQSSHYQIDLTTIHKDDLKIRFNCDGLKTDEAVFYFPKTVPGTYAILDYGRYVKKLKAYTKEGKTLTVKKEGENAFRIYNAKALYHIDYQLQDTWEQAKGNMIFEPAGTGFEAGKYFVLNNGGIFGTIQGYENYPFYIDITTIKGLEGYSSMTKSNTGDVQHFKAKHYHQLIDEPIMFTNQQVETIQVNNCKVTIASYHAADSASHYIKASVEECFKAIGQFTGTLPVEEYNLLIFIDDQRKLGELLSAEKIGFFKIIKILSMAGGMGGYGALEHGSSSFYYMPDFGDHGYTSMVKDIVIHEFMHIYAPLSIHSELIGDFNYLDPKMSKHLWLYEGITEYLSVLIQLQSGMGTLEELVQGNIKSKIKNAAAYPDSIPFTVMSEHVFDKPYIDHYGQVYERGAIMGMLLDFEIMRLSEGNMTLKDVIFKLTQRYGADKSFKEATIIKEIVEMVHPDLQAFFDQYVEGTSSLKIKEGFDVVGIDYEPLLEGFVPVNVLSRKNNGVTYRFINKLDYTDERIRIKSVDTSINWTGFEVGDILDIKTINKSFTNEKGVFIENGTVINLPIIRNGQAMDLSFPAQMYEGSVRGFINTRADKTAPQERMLKIWLGQE